MWTYNTATSSTTPLRNGHIPFAQAIILSIEPDKAATVQRRLAADGVPSEVFKGFDAKKSTALASALQLLNSTGYTRSLHWTFSVPFACIHMSPNTKPDWSGATAEFINHLGTASSNLEEMIASDSHGCVAKVVGIGASHAHLWQELADGRLPVMGSTPMRSDEDKWFLILEEDAVFCPHWLRRLEQELPQAPSDAELLKLSYFGHWRQEDTVPVAPGRRPPSNFFEAKDVMEARGVVSECLFDLLRGSGFGSMPCTGYYAGNQAYMIKRRTARKILRLLDGRPFQDIDVTIMDLVKTYIWRRVLVVSDTEEHPRITKQQTLTFLQQAEGERRSTFIPACNQEPAVALTD